MEKNSSLVELDEPLGMMIDGWGKDHNYEAAGIGGMFDDTLDIRDLERALAEAAAESGVAVTLEDLFGMVELSFRTEAGTDQYIPVFVDSSRTYGIQWLKQFTLDLWGPDELMHREPFADILKHKYDQDQLNQMERESEGEIEYTHRSGNHPVQLVTFGMLQEYLTNQWYGLLNGILKGAAAFDKRLSAYVDMIEKVQIREGFHTTWYRKLLSSCLEADPGFASLAGEAVINFELPGNQLAESQQSQVIRWMDLVEENRPFRMFKEGGRLLYVATGKNTALYGKMMAEMGVHKLGWAAPMIKPFTFLADHIPGMGPAVYSGIGEAALGAIDYSENAQAYTGPLQILNRGVKNVADRLMQKRLQNLSFGAT